MKVSIIIPIYNGEKYINNMYFSLSNQTFQDFEIIYINDGSKDDSLNILNDISIKDSRVKVISQQNSGICASRNRGIEKAQGKYLIFLDQDDGIESDLVEKYVEAIETKKVDVASFGKIHYYIDENGKTVSVKPQIIEEELVDNRERLIECLFNLDNKKRLMTIWNCIYKKEVIDNNNIRFDEHFKHGDEDGMFNIEYAMNSKRVYFSNGCYYHYYIRKGISTITKYNEELLDNFCYYADKVKMLTSDMKEQELNIIRLYLLRFFSSVYGRFCRFHSKFDEKKCFLDDMRKSNGFVFATSLQVLRNKKNIPMKYVYWDVFNFFYGKKWSLLAITWLDLLLGMKKAKR